MCEIIPDPGMGHYRPGVNLDVFPRGNSPRARPPNDSTTTINAPEGLGFPHLAAGIDPVNAPCRARVVGMVDVWKGLIQGWYIIAPRVGEASRCLEEKLSLRACSMNSRQP